MNVKAIFICVLVLAIILSPVVTEAKDPKLPKDEDSYREMAKAVSDSVWSHVPVGFDIDTVPSCYDGCGAVIIGLYNECSARKKNRVDGTSVGLMIAGAVLSGGACVPVGDARKHGINNESLYRIKVKINDDKALDRFSKISFIPTVNFSSGRDRTESLMVVGAKIHKPGGRILEVSSEDFKRLYGFPDGEITENVEIPDLEKGDILDVFCYMESRQHDTPDSHKIFSVRDDYPVMSYSLHCEFDRKLSVCYKSVNGAPELEYTELPDKTFALDMSMSDVKEVPSFLNHAESDPMVLIDIYNTSSAAVPWHARKSGPHANPDPVDVQRSLWEVYTDPMYKSKYNPQKMVAGKPVNKVKKKVKSGEWTETQGADYIWNLVAATYLVGYYGDSWTFFDTLCDTWRKAGLKNFETGLTTPLGAEPIDSLFFTYAADRFAYFPESKRYYFVYRPWNTAGSVPVKFQNRVGVIPLGNKENSSKGDHFSVVSRVTFPGSSATDNLHKSAVELRLDDTQMRILASRTDSCRGAAKLNVSGFSLIELKDRYNDLLGSLDSDVAYDETLFAGWNESDESVWNRKKNKEDEYASDYGKWIMLKDWAVTEYGLESDTTAVVVKSDFIVNDMVKMDNHDLVVEVGAMFEPGNIPDVELGREDPVTFISPFRHEWTVTIDAPEGYGVDADVLRSMNRKVESDWGQTAIEYAIDKSTVVINASFQVDSGIVGVKDVPDLVKLIDTYAELCKDSIKFSKIITSVSE